MEDDPSKTIRSRCSRSQTERGDWCEFNFSFNEPLNSFDGSVQIVVDILALLRSRSRGSIHFNGINGFDRFERRCRDTFHMIMSHQKMAQDLKSRKLFYRPEPSNKTLARLQRIVDPSIVPVLPAQPPTSPPAAVPVNKAEISPEADRESSAEASRPAPAIRRSNTVRIYVPFEKNRCDTPEARDELDVTTRRIEIEDDRSVPRLMRINPATHHSTPQLELHCAPNAQTLVNSSFVFASIELIPRILSDYQTPIILFLNIFIWSMVLIEQSDSLEWLPRWLQSGTVSPISTGSRNSMPNSPRKSTLVRMGTKVSTEALFREKLRLQDVSVCDGPPMSPPPLSLPPQSPTPQSPTPQSPLPSGAYVLGKLIRFQ